MCLYYIKLSSNAEYYRLEAAAVESLLELCFIGNSIHTYSRY